MHRYVLLAALIFSPMTGCAKSEPAPEGGEPTAAACEKCGSTPCACEG